MHWHKVSEWVRFIKLAFVIHNKFWQAACDEAIVDVNGRDGDLMWDEDSRISMVDLKS